MRPENSRQYYLPPSLESPDQSVTTPHPAPAIFARPTSQRERILQHTTYILVSLAAFVYVFQALVGGIAAVVHRPASIESASPEPATAVPQKGANVPPTAGAKPTSETIYRSLPSTR